jgi:hypothetical protein
MHAVIVRVNISNDENAVRTLREQVVPWAAQAPGFVSGYWTRVGNSGLSMVVFESEDAARAASEHGRSMALDGAAVEDVKVREVVAHATSRTQGGESRTPTGAFAG